MIRRMGACCAASGVGVGGGGDVACNAIKCCLMYASSQKLESQYNRRIVTLTKLYLRSRIHYLFTCCVNVYTTMNYHI